MKNYHILISFCNNSSISSSQTFLFEIPDSFEKSDIQVTPIFSGFEDGVASVTGMTSDKKFVYLMNPGTPNRISILEKKTLKIISVQEIPNVVDGHSILASNNEIFIVSTGTDEVISFKIKGETIIDPRTIWKASSTKKDTHHINSIINVNNDLIISAFGPKEGELNSSARNGYIYNVSKENKIKEGIYHPHSLSENNGMIYYCDSSNKSFCSLTENILKLNGYTRGTAWLNNEVVCLTSSIGRTVSKSTGQILNSADPGKPAGRSELIIYHLANQEILTILDLSDYGPETYDILPLDQVNEMRHCFVNAFFEERTITNKYQQLAEFESNKKIQQINQQEKTILKLKTQTDEQKETINNLKAQADEQKETINNLKTQTDEQKETINNLKTQADEQKETINNLKAQADEQKETINNLKTQTDEQKETINNLKTQADEQKETINNLNSQLVELVETKSNLHNKLSQIEQEVLFYATSKSWRVTRPLRKITKFTKRLLKKDR